MKKWNLIVDVSLCTNCNNCVVATQDEYMNNAFEGYSKPGAPGVKTMHVERRIRGQGAMVDVCYVPRMCNHCDEAPCIKAAPDGAIYKRPDGIVMIDPVKAAGRRELTEACPYGAIVWNDQEDVPQSWYFDAHLLDQGWEAPRSVQSCPTGALRISKCTDTQMHEIAEQEKLEVLMPTLGTRPRVYYKNLDRTYRHFIGGNVAAMIGAAFENIADARVTLLRGQDVVQTCRTDAFGDFKFDGLEPGSRGYVVHAEHERFGRASVSVSGELTESSFVNVALQHA